MEGEEQRHADLSWPMQVDIITFCLYFEILCKSGVRFTDQRLTTEQFLEVKPKLPFGQLPIAKIDGESIAQSSAIARQILEYFTRRIIISFNILDF